MKIINLALTHWIKHKNSSLYENIWNILNEHNKDIYLTYYGNGIKKGMRNECHYNS